ncbi:MAG TPA: sigma-70 family RNA polymerase sigma factor [Tepidisphaeraceae bacterium]|jgi:RNA polymerase sigma factor (sigma-70 family)
MITDRELLERFANGDTAAFEAIVARHSGWILSLARRQLHNQTLAEDAAQAVFFVLLRKARSLSNSVHLAGWLYRTTLLATKEIARREARQKRREEQAAMQRYESTRTDADIWPTVAPLLEHMINRLRQHDREIILLRFYAQRSFAEIAAEMNIAEEAARKRVERAIEKLRNLLFAEHICHPADLLGATLLLNVGGTTSSKLVGQILNANASSLVHDIIGPVLKKLHPIKLGPLLVGGGVAAVILVGIVAARSPIPTSPPPLEPNNLLGPVDHLQPATISFDDFFAHVKAAETQIKNIHIMHFQTTIEERTRSNPIWQRMPAADEGSAWFDGNVNGKARVYFKHHVMDWTGNGAHGWIDESIDTGFDGHESRMIRLGSSLIQRSSDGKLSAPPQTPDRYVIVDRKPPLEWGGRFIRYITGLAFTPQFAVMDGEDTTPPHPRRPLSEYMSLLYKAPLPPAASCRLVKGKVNGVDCVGMIFFNPMPPQITCEMEWWFDPQRGYALVRYGNKYTQQAGIQTIQANATAWTEAAPGIWFPIQGVCEESIIGPGSRLTYHADNIVVNDPKFRSGIFLPPLPVGFLISDRRTNRTSIIDNDGETVELHKGEAMPVVKPDTPKPPKD